MLIAAYAGCGKSRAAQELGLLDLPSMPYRWLLPYQDPDIHSQAEFERGKGALHHIGDPRFPQNYVFEILKAERKGKTVTFPTIIPVINMLVERYGRTVHVVCPEDGLKEEYRQRYLKRGNSDSFLGIFINGWEHQMEAIGESRGIHHRLKSGEYLTPWCVRPKHGAKQTAYQPNIARIKKPPSIDRGAVLSSINICSPVRCPGGCYT